MKVVCTYKVYMQLFSLFIIFIFETIVGISRYVSSCSKIFISIFFIDFLNLDFVISLRKTGVDKRRTDDGRRTADDGLRTTDGGRRTADDGRRTADGGRRTADDGRRTADGGRRMAEHFINTW
jgi:hypothetical protein